MDGQEMKMIRTLLGKTQKDFGTELGIPNPQVQVASMETGLRKVSKRLAKAIGLMVANRKQEEALDKAGIEITE